jgi:glycolate oxidase FAD binding subunit
MPGGLAELQRAAPEAVVAADEADAIAGVAARFVAHPRTTAEVAGLLATASGLGLTTVARGAGTKLDWGLPPEEVGLVLDCSRFARVLEYAVPDFVVRVEPGLLLSDLQTQLAACGQRLPIDEVVPGSTVGGLVATGLSGPLRLRFGSVRDLLIGVGFVRADGVSAKSGSKVVKNVAGYDLAKLFTGSYGTLGVITEAIFRLRALPNDEQLVVGVLADEHEAGRALTALARLQVAPSAVEIHRAGNGPVSLGVLLEGAAPVDGRAAEVAQVLGTEPTPVERPRWWGRLPGTTTIKAIVPPAAVPALVGAVTAATRGEAVLSGSAGAGVIYVGLGEGPGDPAVGDPASDDAAPDDAAPEIARRVGAVRELCAAAGGSAVVLACPPAVRALVDVWGPVPGIELMRRVKTEFDPARRLSPGRFVGGI